MDSFVPKKKSAAESVTPEVLVTRKSNKTARTLPGADCIWTSQKFTRFQDVNTIVYILDMLRTHAIRCTALTKVINFRNLQLPVCIGAGPRESIAENGFGASGRRMIFWCVPYDLRTVCLALSGFTKQAASRREAACLCCLWNAYSLRELRSRTTCLRLSCRIRRCRLQGRRACDLYRYPRFHRGCEPCRADER